MTRGHAERVPEYLEHIVDAIDRAIRYISDIDFATFENDTRTQDAVVRTLQVIGEAANQIRRADPNFAAAHSSIPWELMYGMRNRVVHGYFEIDFEVVWRTVEQDLPVLKGQIESAVRTGSENPSGN